MHTTAVALRMHRTVLFAKLTGLPSLPPPLRKASLGPAGGTGSPLGPGSPLGSLGTGTGSPLGSAGPGSPLGPWRISSLGPLPLPLMGDFVGDPALSSFLRDLAAGGWKQSARIDGLGPLPGPLGDTDGDLVGVSPFFFRDLASCRTFSSAWTNVIQTQTATSNVLNIMILSTVFVVVVEMRT